MTTAPVDAVLLTVGELFAEQGTSYVIPIYQRNYSWRQEQIEQLVDDIWSAAKDARRDPSGHESYFLGNLVVAERRKPAAQAAPTELEVVDGQQRLTTLSLLRAALEEDDWLPGDRLHYASRPRATAALDSLLTSEDEDGSGIHTAFKVVKQALSAQVGSDGKAEFAAYLRDSVQLVRATLAPGIDLNRYFEIMNTRGQQLQQVDIVKARLMRHLDPAARDCFAWIWDACAAMDVYVQMSLTRGRTELRREIFGKRWDSLDVASFAQLRALRETAAADDASAPQDDDRGLSAALRTYAAAPPPEATRDGKETRFRSPIEFPSLLLHVLKVMDPEEDGEDGDEEGGLDDNKLIKLFGAWLSETGDRTAARVEAFAEQLLRCRFVLDNCLLKRDFTATNGDDGAWSLLRLANSRSDDDNIAYPPAFKPSADPDDRRDPTTSRILLLQSMLRVTYTSPRAMHWITHVLRIDGVERDVVGAADEVERVLTRFARKRVRRAFLDVDRQPAGFSIERIVFTYLDYLLAKDGSRPDFEFAFRNSIEHFFPQFPDRQQVGATATPDGLDDFGNLALISVGANSKFSNNMPVVKETFTDLVAQSPKLGLMASEARKADWDDAAITAHGEKMVALLRADASQPDRTQLVGRLAGPASST